MDLFNDKIFNNDPIYMESLIGKLVKITTDDNESHTGIVYVIDPIFKTVVLHTKATGGNKHNTLFILYNCIEKLELLSSEICDKTYLERKIPQVENDGRTHLEKERVKKWLQHLHISVDEVGDYLKIDDHLIIMPPYGLDNCVCNNTIVLDKIRNIISSMPQDFI